MRMSTIRLRRWALLCLVLLAGIVHAESPIAAPPEHRRGTEQTFLTFPEWFLVHSPAEYAVYVKENPPDTFPFWGHIGQFWKSYAAVTRATPLARIGTPAASAALGAAALIVSSVADLAGNLDGPALQDLDGVHAVDRVAERRYASSLTLRRLHQAVFRPKVLRAYQSQCALCRLRHSPLLDAAHILPDHHHRGEPVVPNGLAMCKIHHAAYDANIIGIRPDCVVEVRSDILSEIDGPMLRHGLQEMHGTTIFVPRSRNDRPDPTRLDERWEQFRATA